MLGFFSSGSASRGGLRLLRLGVERLTPPLLVDGWKLLLFLGGRPPPPLLEVEGRLLLLLVDRRLVLPLLLLALDGRLLPLLLDGQLLLLLRDRRLRLLLLLEGVLLLLLDLRLLLLLLLLLGERRLLVLLLLVERRCFSFFSLLGLVSSLPSRLVSSIGEKLDMRESRERRRRILVGGVAAGPRCALFFLWGRFSRRLPGVEGSRCGSPLFPPPPASSRSWNEGSRGGIVGAPSSSSIPPGDGSCT